MSLHGYNGVRRTRDCREVKNERMNPLTVDWLAVFDLRAPNVMITTVIEVNLIDFDWTGDA